MCRPAAEAVWGISDPERSFAPCPYRASWRGFLMQTTASKTPPDFVNMSTSSRAYERVFP